MLIAVMQKFTYYSLVLLAVSCHVSAISLGSRIPNHLVIIYFISSWSSDEASLVCLDLPSITIWKACLSFAPCGDVADNDVALYDVWLITLVFSALGMLQNKLRYAKYKFNFKMFHRVSSGP